MHGVVAVEVADSFRAQVMRSTVPPGLCVPHLATVAHGAGACKRCGRRATADEQRFDADRARSICLEVGLTPLAPFPGTVMRN